MFSVKAKDITRNADTIIQKTAPAPPTEMAAATPIMLPVPIEAASDVVKVWKFVSEPEFLLLSTFLENNVYLSSLTGCRI